LAILFCSQKYFLKALLLQKFYVLSAYEKINQTENYFLFIYFALKKD